MLLTTGLLGTIRVFFVLLLVSNLHVQPTDFSGLKNGSIVLWNPLDLNKIVNKKTLGSQHKGRVRDVSYSPDGRFLASIGNDDQIVIRSTEVLFYS